MNEPLKPTEAVSSHKPRTPAEECVFLTTAVKNLADGVLISDKEGNVVNCSDSLYDFWSLKESLVGTNIFRLNELIQDRLKDPPSMLASMQEITKDPNAKLFDVFEFKDGRVCESYSMPLYSDKNVIGRIAVFHDVTQQRKTQALLNENEEKLEEAQKLSKLGSWDLNLSTNLSYLSKEAFSILEIPLSNGPVSLADSLKLIHPEDSPKIAALVERAVNYAAPYELDIRMFTKTRQLKWIRVKAGVSVDGTGKSTNIKGTMQDVTMEKIVQEELKDSSKKLEDANKELESFSYAVSHDLRAPLTAIDGYSQMLLEGHSSQLDDEGKSLLSKIRDNTGALNTLVSDLLNFSKSAKQALELKEFEMSELAQNVFDGLKLLEKDREIQFQIAKLENAPCDPILIREVWFNLISNALKYAGKQKTTVLKVDSRIEATEVIYSIKDNGVGFDSSKTDKLFKVFSRLHPQTEFKGTGLGLSIVQKIIYRHNGRVWAEGRLGEGAVFYFSLPLGNKK